MLKQSNTRQKKIYKNTVEFILCLLPLSTAYVSNETTLGNQFSYWLETAYWVGAGDGVDFRSQVWDPFQLGPVQALCVLPQPL